MTEAVLFHHVQGRTPGVDALAAALRAGGHEVHVPDLFDGHRPATIEDGVAFVRGVDDDEWARRVDAAMAGRPDDVVTIGISWGAAIAQRLAQQWPGVRGAVLLESFVAVDAHWSFGPWPTAVPVHGHGMADDPVFAGDGDLDAARRLVAEVGDGVATVWTYPGDRHLFTDSSLPVYDAGATASVIERTLTFLADVG